MFAGRFCIPFVIQVVEMFPRLVILMSLVLSGSAMAQVPDDASSPKGDTWTELFNGKDLTGWSQKNGTATYQVVDGTVKGTTSEGSPNSFLCSDKEYGDFELQFEVKVHNNLNSGVQIRSQTKDKPTGRVNGPQVEIESGPGQAGLIYGEACGGWMSAAEKHKAKHDHFKNDQWNSYKVIAKGARIQTWINGVQVEDLTDDAKLKSHPKGFIGLQVHGIGKKQGPFSVQWRNIKIREIK